MQAEYEVTHSHVKQASQSVKRKYLRNTSPIYVQFIKIKKGKG